MKGQRNQFAVATYLTSPCCIDPYRLVQACSCFGHLALRLPTALAVFLLQQILVVEIAISQTNTPTPSPNSSSDAGNLLLMRPTLKAGSQGVEVTELQAVLQLLGFFTDTVNGVYGQSTTSAVFQFQQLAGLTPDGVVGPATWNRLLPPAPPSTNLPGALNTAPNGFPLPSSSPSSTSPAQSAPASDGGDRPLPSQTAAKPTPAALPILRLGMQGSAVMGLQDRLRALGFLKSSADGVFGAETLAAVKSAQRKFSLEADGVVGPATWEALLQ